MKKSEIETYHERGSGRCPSINVKVSSFGRGLSGDSLNCSEDVFQTAMEYAYESAQERFWEEAQELAEYHLDEKGPFAGVKIYSAGRSGGHLIVGGLDDVEEWDAIAVTAWGRFENAIKIEMSWLCSDEPIREDIEANQWNEEGAEKYNFYDNKKGVPICISEMKAQAKSAGFGAIIR